MAMNISFEITSAKLTAEDRVLSLDGHFSYSTGDQDTSGLLYPTELYVEGGGVRSELTGMRLEFYISSKDGENRAHFFENHNYFSDKGDDPKSYSLLITLCAVEKDLIWRLYESMENPKRRVFVNVRIPTSDAGPLKDIHSPGNEYVWDLDIGSWMGIESFYLKFDEVDQHEEETIKSEYKLGWGYSSLSLSERLLLSLVDTVQDFRRTMIVAAYLAFALFVVFPALKDLYEKFF